jgi:nucleotide-binding universal stress UspA family protein
MAREGDHMDTIVVAMNGSEEAAASLEFAVKEAALRGSRLRLVSAWEVPSSILGSGVAGREMYDDFRDNAETVVAEAAARAAELDPSVEIETRVAKGQLGNVLLEESRDAAMIVVARRAHGGLRELVLGSVARQTLAHAEIPVLVVHTHVARK